MSKISYSIIIPTRNLTDLLRRCLDSIPHRHDVQIIVVDDNSDPSIVDFENYPGLNEPCTDVIFTKEGKGAGYARNVGLEHAVGEYLIFMDSDDYFLYSINKVLDDYIESEYDIVYFYTQNVDTETYLISENSRGCNFYVREFQSEKPNSDINLRLMFHTPWGKIYRKNFIDKYGIKFDETFKANDIHFGYKAGYYADKIFADHRAIYCLTNRTGSLSTIYSPDACVIISDVYCNFLLFLKEKGLSNSSVYCTIYKGVINMLVRLIKEDSSKYNQVLEKLVGLNCSKLLIYKDVIWGRMKCVIKQVLKR